MSKDIIIEAEDLSCRLLKGAMDKLDHASGQLGKINRCSMYCSPTGSEGLYPDDICADIINLKISIDALRKNIASYARLIDEGPQSLVSLDSTFKNDLVNGWSRFGFFLSEGLRNTSDRVTEIFTDLFGIRKRRTGGEIVVDSSIELSTNGTETTIQTKVFDKNGSYGGNQGGPYEETDSGKREKYYAIIRQNIDDRSWTEKELEQYLQEIKAMGCAYTAYANIILQHFENSPDLFEDIFGYPMYTSDGEMNFNELIVDIVSFHKETATGVVNGVNYWDMQFELDNFLEDHNIPVAHETKFIEQSLRDTLGLSKVVTPKTFEDLAAEGKHIIVNACACELDGAEGTTAFVNGHHAMVVTGVTVDGRYIVSSWGKKFYLSPDSGTQEFWTVSLK